MNGPENIGEWMLLLGLLAAVLFISFKVLQPKIESWTAGVTSVGCPVGEKITGTCLCNFKKASSGYCCESGQSNTPCYCGLNLKTCPQYSTEPQCTQNLCGVGAPCKWEGSSCVVA